MIWRLVVVSWALALLAGLTVYFSGPLINWFGLDVSSGLHFLRVSEVTALLFAILGTLGLCLKLLMEFVLAPNT